MKKQPGPTPKLHNNSSLIDTHCHLDMAVYQEDFDSILETAKTSGITTIISIGIDIESSRKAIRLAQKHKQIHATIGIHPHDVDNIHHDDYQELREMHRMHQTHIVGYGEIGLDYVKQYSSQENQKKHFRKQLELAVDLDLPVVIHNREADNDTIDILKQVDPTGLKGVMHCFSGDYAFACKVLDLGMYLSIPGVVTFKNASTLHEVVRKVPLDRLVCETDGPFLAPHPFRGKQNRPDYLVYTAQKIADLKGITIDEVAETTTQNAKLLFRLQS